MPTINLICLIFFNSTFLLLDVYGICLMFGVGGGVLAGVNLPAKATTAKKEYKYIVRRSGICLLIVDSIMHIGVTLLCFGKYISGGIISGLIPVSIVVMMCLENTKTIKQKKKIVRKSMIK